MATFNNSGAYSILSTQKGTYYVQGGHYFAPATFVDLGTTAPTDYQSLSSERSDAVNISGGSLNGVTIGAGSTISAPISGPITGATITGGTINGTNIGNITPAAGAFTTFNSTSANILGPLSASQGVNSTTDAQVAGTANTGVNIGASSNWGAVTYYDSTRSANNKTLDNVWQSGVFSLRFKDDAGSAATSWFTATGGYASGVTAIASSSGSGAWSHTGGFNATTMTASGFNTVTLTGAISGSSPTITTAGGNADVGLVITAKGAGGIVLSNVTSVTGAFSASGAITPSTTAGIVGTTLANNANAGSIGEVITNTGTDVSLTTAVSANVTSVTLTAGDWDVYGSIAFNGTASTSTSRIVGGLSTVSATLPAQPYYYQHQYGVGGFTSATLPNGSLPMQRINVSVTTTVYLVAQATFTASTETATGVIIARRAR